MVGYRFRFVFIQAQTLARSAVTHFVVCYCVLFVIIRCGTVMILLLILISLSH